MTDIHGEPLRPEALQLSEYVRTRAAEMSMAAIRDRIRAAAHELENLVDSIDPAEARRQPVEGKWTIAAVVDHIAQTQIRAAEELRHLSAGRRPPLPPVYEALRSGRGRLGSVWGIGGGFEGRESRAARGSSNT